MTSAVNSVVTFCFWKSKRPAEPGHVGVLCSGLEQDKYHAFWPKNTFLANFWTGIVTLPLLGRAVTSFEMDKKIEERNPDLKISFSVTPEKFKEIDDYINQSRKEIEEGKKLYSLTPKYPVFLNTAKFIARVAHKTWQFDSVTELDMDFPHEKHIDVKEELKCLQDIRLGHCTTDARDIFSILVGASNVAQTNFPWVISPNRFSEFVAAAPGAQIEEIPQEPPEPGSAGDLCYIV